jgi:hypothetical protein
MIFTLLHVGEDDRFPEIIMPQRELWRPQKTGSAKPE